MTTNWFQQMSRLLHGSPEDNLLGRFAGVSLKMGTGKIGGLSTHFGAHAKSLENEAMPLFSLLVLCVGSTCCVVL